MVALKWRAKPRTLKGFRCTTVISNTQFKKRQTSTLTQITSILNLDIFFVFKIQNLSKKKDKTTNDVVRRTFTTDRRVMQWAAHQLGLAPAQWAFLHIHHVSFLVHEDGTDLMHWMRNYLFFHMPVLVIGFSGSCQFLPFANKGHMFPQREVWQMACCWFYNFGIGGKKIILITHPYCCFICYSGLF